MTNRDLEKLKAKLPRGYRIMLWKKLGNVSLSAISAVMRGDYNNERIIDAAIELAREYQNGIKERKETINSL